MEYVRYRGEFLDLPLDRIKDTLQRHYGPLLSLTTVDFDEVLVYGKTYRIADRYGEGGLLTGKSFIIAVTTNVKKDD